MKGETLADRACVPCRGGTPPLPRAQADALLQALEAGWSLNDAGHLQHVYPFADFAAALSFANQVGAVAETEGHHPDLHLGWGHCTVEIWTHAIAGLTESDFYLAAKVDRVHRNNGG